MLDLTEPLYWDAAYAVAKALGEAHPEVLPENVTLQQITSWTLALPTFVDDPELVNDELLEAILQEWYEEAIAHGKHR